MNSKEQIIYQNKIFTIEELEEEWRMFSPKPSERELLEIFGAEAKIYLYEKLFQQKKAFWKLAKEVSRDLKRIYKNYSGFTQWFLVEVIRTFKGETLNWLKKEIWRNQFLLAPNNKKEEITQAMIERARQHPIENLIQVNKNFALCPNHNEKHPSFYVKGNYGYCFSCGYTCDTIRLLMDRDGLNFVEAVKRLN